MKMCIFKVQVFTKQAQYEYNLVIAHIGSARRDSRIRPKPRANPQPKATLGSVPCACVLVSPLYKKRLRIESCSLFNSKHSANRQRASRLGLTLGVWGVVPVVCMCVGVGGVVCVCVCDLLICLRRHSAQRKRAPRLAHPAEAGGLGLTHLQDSSIHRRCIYKGDTSTHAQGTDPRVALGA